MYAIHNLPRGLAEVEFLNFVKMCWAVRIRHQGVQEKLYDSVEGNIQIKSRGDTAG